MLIGKTEISVSGRFLKIAKLRHEWFEYLDDPVAFIQEAKQSPGADILTFLQEAHYERPTLPFRSEPASISMLTFKSFDVWWKEMNGKARNQVRKAQKSGVELREVKLDDDFVRGVQVIYDESPLRQNRKFAHYGKDFATIKEDLSSFLDCSIFVGAYHEGRLIGFMKLFAGQQILRVIHIIATFVDRDKCPMDGLIAKAVEIAGQKNISHLHYGDWTHRGLGAFRLKFGFDRHDCTRYFVPLNARGNLALKLGLHRSMQERMPQAWRDRLIQARSKWYDWRYRGKKAAAEN
jgi:hypothetical protein